MRDRARSATGRFEPGLAPHPRLCGHVRPRGVPRGEAHLPSLGAIAFGLRLWPRLRPHSSDRHPPSRSAAFAWPAAATPPDRARASDLRHRESRGIRPRESGVRSQEQADVVIGARRAAWRRFRPERRRSTVRRGSPAWLGGVVERLLVCAHRVAQRVRLPRYRPRLRRLQLGASVEQALDHRRLASGELVERPRCGARAAPPATRWRSPCPLTLAGRRSGASRVATKSFGSAP